MYLPFGRAAKNFRTQGVVEEPSVEDWGVAVEAVGFVLGVVVPAVVRAVEATLSTRLLEPEFGFDRAGNAVVAVAVAVAVVAPLGALDLDPFFLLFIMVEILWE